MQNSYNPIIHKQLFIGSIIYLIILLVILCIYGYTPTNDGESYLEYAKICLNERQPYPTTTIYQTAPFIWNIGIINITELSIWIFHSITPLLILLCVLKAITALFLSLTTERLFGSKTALVCLLIFSAYPNNWGQSTMISSEIPSTMLAVMAIYIIVCHEKDFLCGILLACANWFRPTASIFLLSILIGIILFVHKQRFKRIGLLLSGFILFITIVGSSCFLRTGHFIYQARSYWFSMVDECYDGAAVAPHWGQPIWPKGTPRYIEHHEYMDCFDFERIWKQRSIDWLKEHPIEYLGKIPGRLFYMYQSDYDNISAFLTDKAKAENNHITIPFRHLKKEYNTLNMAQWLSLISLIFYILILLSAAIGTAILTIQRKFETLFLPLFIIVVGTLALVVLMHGETRFKDPLMPFIIMLSSYFIGQIITKKNLTLK